MQKNQGECKQEEPCPGLYSELIVIFFLINMLKGSLEYNLPFVMDNICRQRFVEGEERRGWTSSRELK